MNHPEFITALQYFAGLFWALMNIYRICYMLVFFKAERLKSYLYICLLSAACAIWGIMQLFVSHSIVLIVGNVILPILGGIFIYFICINMFKEKVERAEKNLSYETKKQCVEQAHDR